MGFQKEQKGKLTCSTKWQKQTPEESQTFLLIMLQQRITAREEQKLSGYPQYNPPTSGICHFEDRFYSMAPARESMLLKSAFQLQVQSELKRNGEDR